MPKKRSAQKHKSYSSFKLHGSYPKQRVLMYMVMDFLISGALGVMFQPSIVKFVSATLGGN